MSDSTVMPTTEPVMQPTITQPQTVTVDMDAINRAAEARAEQAAQGVVKDMLARQGLDDESIKGVLAEWRAKQPNPEAELKQRDDTIGQLQQQLESERQEKIALSKGVPVGTDDETAKEKVNACLTLAKSYVSDKVTFEQALDKALGIIKFGQEQLQANIPRFDSGGGKSPISGMTIEDYKKMSYNEKLALKEKSPNLYEQFKKALGFK